MARTHKAAVLIIAALVHAAFAENDVSDHESAEHHGVQGRWANSGSFSSLEFCSIRSFLVRNLIKAEFQVARICVLAAGASSGLGAC